MSVFAAERAAVYLPETSPCFLIFNNYSPVLSSSPQLLLQETTPFSRGWGSPFTCSPE